LDAYRDEVPQLRKDLAAANERAGGDRGGDPEARAARWVSSDALRELTSERVVARLRDKEARAYRRSTRSR